MALRLFAPARGMAVMSQVTRRQSSSLVNLYNKELERVKAQKDDGVDTDLVNQMAALKEKSQMELESAVKHADSEVADLIKGMPEWVDKDVLQKEFDALKSKAPKLSFSSPFYPAPAAEAAAKAANMKLLHTAYAKAL